MFSYSYDRTTCPGGELARPPLKGSNPRSGHVYALTFTRKRQAEFIAFLSLVDRQLLASITHVFLVLDNLKMQKGRQVQAWLATHPRFSCHFTPVHCSWMNQIEQWFGILQRKRLRVSDSSSLDQLAERLLAFAEEWNAHAHPFNWSTKSVAKVMAKCEMLTVSGPAA